MPFQFSSQSPKLSKKNSRWTFVESWCTLCLCSNTFVFFRVFKTLTMKFEFSCHFSVPAIAIKFCEYDKIDNLPHPQLSNLEWKVVDSDYSHFFVDGIKIIKLKISPEVKPTMICSYFIGKVLKKKIYICIYDYGFFIYFPVKVQSWARKKLVFLEQPAAVAARMPVLAKVKTSHFLRNSKWAKIQAIAYLVFLAKAHQWKGV